MKKLIAGWFVMVMLIGGIICFVNLSTNAEVNTGDAGIRPTSWEQVENDGSYSNPEHAYDNEYNDTSTKAIIESPIGAGSESKSYEALAYNFILDSNTTNGTLYFTWKTSVGTSVPWDPFVSIFYWNWNTSEWDDKGTWGDLAPGTRALPITSVYINPGGFFKVKFLSKSGCSCDSTESTTIELYDIYIHPGEMITKAEPSIDVAKTVSNDLHMLLATGMVCIIGLTVIYSKKQEKYIKLSLSKKHSMITAIISFIIIFAVFTFLNSEMGEHLENAIVPSTLLVTVVMALLIGIVMGMFIYSIKKCGIAGRKERGVGIGGVIVSLVAAFTGCCGSIIIAFISVGAAVFLAKYGIVFKTAAVALLFFSVILMARNIKKEEVCLICEPTASVKATKVKEESDDECCKTGIKKE